MLLLNLHRRSSATILLIVQYTPVPTSGPQAPSILSFVGAIKARAVSFLRSTIKLMRLSLAVVKFCIPAQVLAVPFCISHNFGVLNPVVNHQTSEKKVPVCSGHGSLEWEKLPSNYQSGKRLEEYKSRTPPQHSAKIAVPLHTRMETNRYVDQLFGLGPITK